MKSLSITILVVAFVFSNVHAQTAGGAAGASGSAAPGTPGTAAPAAPGQPKSPVVPGRGQTPPQVPLQPNQQVEPAPTVTTSSSNGSVSNSADANASVTQSNMTAQVTNQFSASNQFGFDTNQFGGSNGFGVSTNGSGTNFLGGGVVDTNQLGAVSNQFGLTNGTGGLLRDQAITSADRQLLTQLRAAVFGGNVAPEQLAAQPVHFILANGVVRLVGDVTSMEQRQQIEAAVQRVPGVVRIYDALSISSQPNLSVNVLPGNTPPNALSPVSEPGVSGNRVYATNSPNSSPAPQPAPSFPGTAPSGPTPGRTPP